MEANSPHIELYFGIKNGCPLKKEGLEERRGLTI